MVVPFDPSTDKLVALDFTSHNKELNEEILNNIDLFCNYIDKKLANARYGIGGYAEHRTIYSRSALFDGEEPRRLHLGIDIWGKANTPVIAPLDGKVHSYAFNNNVGDYGATIILQHEDFYTLYGHLNLASLKDLYDGKKIMKGETFAALGIPSENGHWPPHLHFQIIKDMENKKGDYPGVCRFSERDYYLNNCPDPDMILQMNQFIEK